MNTKEIGDFGEDIAVRELLKKGYTILERNYHSRFGEIDIIAKKGTYVVFVEVKLRKNTEKGMPKEAVTKQKQRKILMTAQRYISQKKLDNVDFRFDVIEIIKDKEILFNHIENAFWIEG